LLSTWLLTAAPEARSGENATERFDAAQVFRVRFQDSLLSLEAARTPWTQVLKEIQQATGMRFHHAYPLKGAVSVFLAALPVTQALEQLFGPQASFKPWRAAEGRKPWDRSGKRWRTQTQACGSWLWKAWLLGRRAKRCSRRRSRTPMRPFASWLRSG
ncbi:MAG: hypothetical protein ACREXY_13600, partial [Gammaproteobacteria bacterium]